MRGRYSVISALRPEGFLFHTSIRFLDPEVRVVSERHQGSSGRHEHAGSGWLDCIIRGDARDMSLVPDEAISLIVTSPPY